MVIVVYVGISKPLQSKFVKVACVIKIKLFFYGLILLQFDNTNKVMQNAIQKFKQSSIVFDKPGILSANLKNFDELQLSYGLIFFAEISHTFSTYHCLNKGVRDFFYFI